MENRSKRPLLLERKIIPMTYDIDIEDHVNNIVYIRWMEDLRYFWLDRFFPLKLMTDRDFAPAIVETCIRYLHPIRLFEAVTGNIWVSEMRGVRFTLEFEFSVAGRPAALGTQSAAWIRVSTGRPVRCPLELRQMWEREKST